MKFNLQVMSLLQKIYEQLFPPILKNQKSTDSACDEPQRPTFPHHSRVDSNTELKEPKLELKSPEKAIVPQVSQPASANKTSATKPGPVKASRDILPVSNTKEDPYLAQSKDPRRGKDMLSDLKSVDSEEDLTEEEQMRMIED